MSVFNAEISAGSLMPLESKRLANLLLNEPSEDQWHEAIITANILQKSSPATAKRQATLIRKRLMTLDPTGWSLIVSGSSEVSLQLLLAASIQHSRLLGDFMLQVYLTRFKSLETTLTKHGWQDFLNECSHLDACVMTWSDSTRLKLFQVILRILAEAKYLDSARTLRLTPQSLHPDVRRYLMQREDRYALHCMDIAK